MAASPHKNSSSTQIVLASKQGLLDNDENVDELLTASALGRVDIVRRILNNEPYMILVGDAMGDTALHLAAKAGHCNVVSELIRIAKTIHGQLNRAMVDQNVDEDTALHLAIKNGHLEAARCLIGTRDNPDRLSNKAFYVFNKDRKLPRDLAEQFGYIDLVSSMQPDYAASSFQDFVTADIEMLIGRRILEDESHDEVDHETWHRICRAIQRRSQEGKVAMRILEEKPSLMKCVDSIQGTLVHVAARAGDVGMIRKLVQYIINNNPNPGCEVARLMSKRDETGNNPLHLAIEQQKLHAAFYLTEVAPQAVYKVNDKGVSPLYIAVEEGYKDLVSFMVNRGEVSMSIKQSLVSHAMEACLAHAAIKANDKGLLQVLMEKLPCLIDSLDVKGWKPLSYAASKGYIDQVRFLLKNFPDSVNKRDRDGSMPVHKAIAGGRIDVVKEMITKCPQSLCHMDRKSRSTLDIATRYGKADILSYLFKEKDVKKLLLNLRDNK